MADARRHYNNDGMDPDWKPADRPSPSATSNEEPNLVGLADRVEYWVDPARCEYELAEGGQVPRIRLELRLRGSEWAKVIKALRSLDSEIGAWIKSADRLPESDTPVLVRLWNGEIRIGELRWERPTYEETFAPFQYWDDPTNDGQDWDGPDHITHWMPLPEAPK